MQRILKGIETAKSATVNKNSCLRKKMKLVLGAALFFEILMFFPQVCRAMNSNCYLEMTNVGPKKKEDLLLNQSQINLKHTKYALTDPATGEEYRIEFKSFNPGVGSVEASLTHVSPTYRVLNKVNVRDNPNINTYVRVYFDSLDISADRKKLVFIKNDGLKFSLELAEPFSYELMKISSYQMQLPVFSKSALPEATAPVKPESITFDFDDRFTNTSIIHDPRLDFYEIERASLHGKLEEYRFLMDGGLGEISIMIPQFRESGEAYGTAVFFRSEFEDIKAVDPSVGQPIRFDSIRISSDKKELTFSMVEDQQESHVHMILKLAQIFKPGTGLKIAGFLIEPDSQTQLGGPVKIFLKTVDTTDINFKGTDAQEIQNVIATVAIKLPLHSLLYRGLVYRDGMATVVPGNSTLMVESLLEGLRGLGLRPDHPIFKLKR
jgi:hypothetical protein